MSRRQKQRVSHFQEDMEAGVRSAAASFRDNDAETSISVAIRLWWTSGLRGRRFAMLVRQAHEITQERISLGMVERGEPGRRAAMPYFFAVLDDLVGTSQGRRTQGPRQLGQRSR
jgi:hypothetical protein